MANVWVKANMKKPERYVTVLCYCRYDRGRYYDYALGFYDHDKTWSGSFHGRECEVLFWRPLPAPPKGIKRDD